MVIALLCSAQGCPVGVEVFSGNTQDASTVPEKIAQSQRHYGLKEIIFVGDRGMITKTVADKIKGLGKPQITYGIDCAIIQKSKIRESQEFKKIHNLAPSSASHNS